VEVKGGKEKYLQSLLIIRRESKKRSKRAESERVERKSTWAEGLGDFFKRLKIPFVSPNAKMFSLFPHFHGGKFLAANFLISRGSLSSLIRDATRRERAASLGTGA
jgi:hypothetical protein